jgi:hypothetical protein
LIGRPIVDTLEERLLLGPLTGTLVAGQTVLDDSGAAIRLPATADN